MRLVTTALLSFAAACGCVGLQACKKQEPTLGSATQTAPLAAGDKRNVISEGSTFMAAGSAAVVKFAER